MRDSRQGIIEYLQQTGNDRQKIVAMRNEIMKLPDYDPNVVDEGIMYCDQAIAIIDMQAESGTRAIMR